MYFKIIFIAIFCLAIFSRVHNIDVRPMHGDEANQAYRFQLLHEKSIPIYDARDYHGPTLYYAMRPLAWLSGKDYRELDKSDYRLLTTIFSLLSILLCLAFKDALGSIPTLALAFFMAISPANVFYSTYFIQESLLICFTLAFFACAWHFRQSLIQKNQKNSRLYTIGIGLAIGLMIATKETSVFVFMAFGIALFFFQFKSKIPLKKIKEQQRNLIYAALAMIFVYTLFYSSFGSNPKGVIEPFKAISTHIQRGLGSSDLPKNTTAGAAHTKPFNYYAYLLIGSWTKSFNELAETDINQRSRSPQKIIKSIWRNQPSRPINELFLCALALLGSLFILLKKEDSPLSLFCLIYTLSIFLIYSLIPYKTPWCVLSILLGLYFLAAYAIKVLLVKFSSVKSQVIIFSLLALCSIDLIRQNILLSDLISTKNPYAYAHPVFNIEDLNQQVDDIAFSSDLNYNLPIHFITHDYWPLPWYLRKYNKVAYWDHSRPSTQLSELPIIIYSTENQALSDELASTHTSSLYGLRTATHLNLACRNDLWQQLLKQRENLGPHL
ncbi:phospholipid carrier-dependent glycosyltransferase [Lentisphaera profundi]|uniref:Phospholipid carrier-dependent glycosyltransferase n=1 Tax=Lentisphaera profundi TaxID=1658616 RepID=A0ABY7VY08_9BACT|nr:phospholipid carrier-dependent glycosyltransferase [Lentisphaera profundi]WDE98602.1 phospholipid carrier-dependent glycosyltransferase [Lentisphaera profundi]